MKSRICLLVVIVCAIGFVSCSKSSSSSPSSGTVTFDSTLAVSNFQADTITISALQDSISFEGITTSNDIFIQLATTGTPLRAGTTYTQTDSTPSVFTIYYGTSTGAGYYSPSFGVPYKDVNTITITSISSKAVAGTYSATLYFNGDTTSTKNPIKGTFNGTVK